MSAYAEICSMFEQRRKVEEEYASAAYSQLLTFVELFEFYIGCQQPDLVVPLRIDEACTPLPDQTASFRIVNNKMNRRRLHPHGGQKRPHMDPHQRQAHLVGGMFHGNRLWN